MKQLKLENEMFCAKRNLASEDSVEQRVDQNGGIKLLSLKKYNYLLK